jgi:dCMP deaminase
MVARAVACRSLCSRDRVGAVIVDYRNRIISTGYNGSPEGFTHNDQPCHVWCARAVSGGGDSEYGTCPALHAEANALMVCDRVVREGGTIYVTSDVCISCAKLIANSGLERVIVQPTQEMPHRNAGTGYSLLRSCGLDVEILDVLQ